MSPILLVLGIISFYWKNNGRLRLSRRSCIMSTPNDGTNTFARLWERLALGLLTFIVSCLFLTYQYQREDYKALEEKVLTMQTSKVSKEDMKDVELRLNNKIDAAISNLISRSSSDKADIISRLEYLLNSKK
jgi:hypothetical protein